MQARFFAEIANWVAFNATRLIDGPDSLTVDLCNQYWSQSKCRQQRWIGALKMFERDFEADSPTHDPWPAIEIVVQEILLTEMLTRVWSAALVAHDKAQNSDELSNIAHSIHIGHVEARTRAIRLLLGADSLDPDTFDRLNSLRRKVERWTDLLLSQLADTQTAMQFGFQPARVRDLAAESSESTLQETRTRRVIYRASLAEEFGSGEYRYSANPELNRQIANGLFGCFPEDRFDSYGLPKSLRLMWLEKATDDTELLVEDLAALEADSNLLFPR